VSPRMIRLAVFGAPNTPWQAITARLRDMELQSNVKAEYDAAAFFAPPTENGLEACLDAGKPVLVAAEACPSVEMLDAWTARAQRTQTPLIVANGQRYLPSRQLIRQQLESGKLGEPGLVRSHRWEPGAGQTSPDWPAAVAGDLDLVSWLLGKAPHLVYAVEQTGADARVRVGVHVHLGFAGGEMALVDYFTGAKYETGYSSLTVIGSAGAAYADDHANSQLILRNGSPQAVRTDEGLGRWVSMLQEFAVAIGERRSAFACWRRALLIGEAAEKSLRAREAVVLELE
jgi:predicted dehydrogenase